MARRRTLPVVLQMAAADCGAACLAMVLGYHGRSAPLGELRERLGTGRDGATAAALARVGRGYGLAVKAYSTGADGLVLIPCPAVLHWNGNHFVVLERLNGDGGALIADPAQGRRRVSAAELAAGFSGIVLAMEPGPGFQTGGPPRGRARAELLLGLFREPGTRRTLAAVLAASLLLQGLGLALPSATRAVVDHVLPGRDAGAMEVLAMGIVAVVAAQAALAFGRGALLVRLQARLDARLMTGFFGHLMRLPFRFFGERTSGDLLQRLSSNLVLREVLSGQTVGVLLDGSLVISYVLLMALFAPHFAGVALALGALQVAVVLGTTRRVHELLHRELATQAEASGFAIEALKGIAQLKASGTEGRALEQWSALFGRQLTTSVQRARLSAGVEAALSTLRSASPLVVLWVGAALVLRGEMSLGTMLGLNTMTVAFLAPLSSLVSSTQRLQLVGAHLDRILDVMSTPAEARPAAPVPLPERLSGRIELRGVGFRYAPDAPWVLRGVSLTVEPGEKVALVGRTGSGKSTLAALLLGLYEPTEGEVLYDGIPVSAVELPALRARFGVVLQEPSLFSGPVRRNIASHDPALPPERIVSAARLACVHDEIAAMPLGYDTPLAEGGAGLSGGQRQRLALARALARDPAVLLLDEATSHLDAVTEERVDASLNTLRCTRVVIAHRMSTVRNADQILVLDEGRVVERGTHGELAMRGGAYAELVEGQREEVREFVSA